MCQFAEHEVDWLLEVSEKTRIPSFVARAAVTLGQQLPDVPFFAQHREALLVTLMRLTIHWIFDDSDVWLHRLHLRVARPKEICSWEFWLLELLNFSLSSCLSDDVRKHALMTGGVVWDQGMEQGQVPSPKMVRDTRDWQEMETLCAASCKTSVHPELETLLIDDQRQLAQEERERQERRQRRQQQPERVLPHCSYRVGQKRFRREIEDHDCRSIC